MLFSERDSRLLNCICDFPQICPRHKRRVYQPDIDQCKATGQPFPTIARTCRDCFSQGPPVLAANGKQVGSEGCGCTGLSVPSGVLWWTCEATEKATREDRARSCDQFTAKN